MHFSIFQHTNLPFKIIYHCVLNVVLTLIFLELTEQQRVMLLSRSPSGPKKYFPIPVENLEEEIRIRSADEGKLFREEFNVSPQIWSEEQHMKNKGQMETNLLKCYVCDADVSEP